MYCPVFPRCHAEMIDLVDLIACQCYEDDPATRRSITIPHPTVYTGSPTGPTGLAA